MDIVYVFLLYALIDANGQVNDIYSKGPILIFRDALIRREHTTALYCATSSMALI
jgi:hypothetical protein